jgi:hypothetical protein
MPENRFWLETVRTKSNEILLDYPKKSGYFGGRTESRTALNTRFLTGGIPTALLYTGKIKSDMYDHKSKALKQFAQQRLTPGG